MNFISTVRNLSVSWQRWRKRYAPIMVALCTTMAANFLASGAVIADEEELARRLAKLERALDNRALIEMSERLQALQSEVQSLRGQLEESQYTIEQLRRSQRQAYVDLDQRIQEALRGNPDPMNAGEPPLTVYQPGSQPEVAGTPAPGIAVEVDRSLDSGALPGADIPAEDLATENIPNADMLGPAPQTGQVPPDRRMDNSTAQDNLALAVDGQTAAQPLTADQAYREAFGLLKAGKYDESIEAFNLFLLDHPNSEYADNAQYWLGETYFVKQQYIPAIDEYRKLITEHPASKKQSHAMLKIGYSFERLGELDKAQTVLKDLQTRYPGTTAARLAAERLQQILSASPQ